MRASVEAAFLPYNTKFEGIVFSMYADILGLITVGVGNLVDPMTYALSLPFVHRDGSPASREDIAAQWLELKRHPEAARHGWRYAERFTSIRLTQNGVHALVVAKAKQNEAVLVKRCPDFESWPADAQLALHSWSWACGPGGKWPRFMAALNARDFELAAVESHMDESGPDRILGTADDNWGLKPRNVAQKELFRNAAKVQSEGGMFDPDALLYTVSGLMPAMPVTHTPPKQDPVIVDDSSRIVHRLDYAWPHYSD